MADDNKDTTTSSTTQTTTNQASQGQASIEPITPTEMNRVGTKPAGSASMGVDDPANDPTTNDTEQTQDDRLAESRRLAMANHAAEKGYNEADQSSRSEEEVA